MQQSHVRTSLGEAAQGQKPAEPAPESPKSKRVRALLMLGVIVLLLVLAFFTWYEPSGKNDYVPPTDVDPSTLPPQPVPQRNQPGEQGQQPPPGIMAG